MEDINKIVPFNLSTHDSEHSVLYKKLYNNYNPSNIISDKTIHGLAVHINNKFIYQTYIGESQKRINDIKKILLFLNLLTKDLNNHILIGIDFEYNNFGNKREIALCQLCVTVSNPKDLYLNNKGYIILVNPATLPDDVYMILESLFLSDVPKILHGSESLDVPYLFNEFFKKDKNKILQFTEKMHDTKFVCDAFNIKFEKKDKCNVYAFMLTNNVISEKVYNDLLENEKAMGPIQNVYVDVNKLNSNQKLLKYVIYDSICLGNMFDKINELEHDIVKGCQLLTRLSVLIRNNVITDDEVKQYKIDKDNMEIYNRVDYFRNIIKKIG